MTGLKSFLFTQATPAAAWTINHDLGHHPVLDIVVDYEGTRQKILPLSIQHVSDTQTVVNFSAARSGAATLF